MSVDTAFQQLREANPVPNPALLTDASADFASLLDATRQRSTDMQTQERTRQDTQQKPERHPWMIALAAAAAVVVIGVLVVISNLGGSSDVVDTPVDVGGANPIQVVNDQGSRATITFAGDAQALVVGGAHIVDIQMEIEANTNSPGISVNLVSTDGVITTTGMTDAGDSFTPTWAWTPDGDKVVITMVGRGVSIPDTRPSVVVSVQGTASSEPVEFVLTAASGARPGGSG